MRSRTAPAPARAAAPDARRDRLALASLLAFALALRLAFAFGTAGLTMDSPLYVRLAEAIARGAREPSPAHHGYSILVALASFVAPGRELPGRLVSLAASLASVALLWSLARRVVSRPYAFAAGLALALHPLAAVYGAAVMTEATFLALALAAWLAFERGGAFAGGAWLGAGYWVRPESLVLAPLAALLARARRPAALALAGAVAAGALYLPVLRWQQGAWTLTPKTRLVEARATSAHDAEWSLADSADAAARAASGAASPGALARAATRDYAPRLAGHLRRVLDAWPLPLLALSLAGLWRVRPSPWLAALALPFADALLNAPDDVRFALFLVPTLALLAARGAERLASFGRASRVALIAAAIGGLAWAWFGAAGTHAMRFDDGPMAELRGIGAWLGAHSDSGDAVMDRKAFVPFFANRRHVQLPDDPLPDVVAYARRTGVRWIVVEEYVAATMRPQLRELIAEPQAAEARHGLRLRHALRTDERRGVALFEVLNAR